MGIKIVLGLSKLTINSFGSTISSRISSMFKFVITTLLCKFNENCKTFVFNLQFSLEIVMDVTKDSKVSGAQKNIKKKINFKRIWSFWYFFAYLQVTIKFNVKFSSQKLSFKCISKFQVGQMDTTNISLHFLWFLFKEWKILDSAFGFLLKFYKLKFELIFNWNSWTFIKFMVLMPKFISKLDLIKELNINSCAPRFCAVH